MGSDPDPNKLTMDLFTEHVCKTEPILDVEINFLADDPSAGLKVELISAENPQKIQIDATTSLEDTTAEKSIPNKPARNSRKSRKCCEDLPKVKVDRATTKPRRCTAFSLWVDELQKQMAAAPKPKPFFDLNHKQLQKKWSNLARLQKNYWRHRAKLVNAGDKGKAIEKKMAKRRGRVEVKDVEKMIGSSKIAKQKVELPCTEEKKDDKAMELMVELLPVKDEEVEPSPKSVVLVYSAYTLWLLNFRRKVSPEMSDALGSGSKLAARLWEGLSMKERVIWNNRAVQVNGMLRHGWETATMFAAVKRYVLGEKLSRQKKAPKVAPEVDPLAVNTNSTEAQVFVLKELNPPVDPLPAIVQPSEPELVIKIEAPELSIPNIEPPTIPIIIKQEPVPIPEEAVSRLKLISDSLNIVGDYLRESESSEVTNNVAWLVASLHSSVEPLSALAHGLNLPALQSNVEQLRSMFQRQRL